MRDADPRAGLFPALLKHWRHRRGLSQLDLALAADVSSRHVSFLETGRSRASAEMVVRLAAALDVPLRHVDGLLRASGHPARYATESAALPAVAVRALELIEAHAEPFPVVTVDRTYEVLRANAGARALLAALVPDAAGPLNLARATFDPAGAHPRIANFDEVGRSLLRRVQREVLAAPDDGALRELLDDVLSQPTVPGGWRTIDLDQPSDPALVVHLRLGADDLRFVAVITAFQAPQSVALDELRIEQWFPVDDATAAACRRLVAGGPLA